MSRPRGSGASSAGGAASAPDGPGYRIGGALSRATFFFLLVTVGGFAVAGAIASLPWRLSHDTPILIYLGWLIEHGQRVPYRDFFDMNLPGTYAIFAVAGRVLGHGDRAFRLLDLGLLAALLGATAMALRPFGARVWTVGGALFALQYLSLGPTHSLQREYLMLVPLALAMWTLSPAARLGPGTRAVLSGVWFGVAATIKPAFLIGLPAVLVYLHALARTDGEGAMERRARAPVIPLAVLGALAPLALMLGALALCRALGPFLDMAFHYWPLYARIGALHQTIDDHERVRDMLWGVWAMGGRRWWLLPAALGLARVSGAAGRRDPRRAFAWLLGGLMICYALYPAAAGQFWPYHWLPFAYLVCLLGAMCLLDPRAGRWGMPLAFVAPLVLAGVFLLKGLPPRPLYDTLTGHAAPAPLRGRVDAMAAYLRTHTGPGDTVQPLDWTGGAVHAMLLARVPLATPFVYDFHFYHHVSRPYIRALRERFVAALAAARPRVIIWVETDKPWVSGEDTTRKFPALETFLADHYRIDALGDGYVMLMRTDGAAPGAALPAPVGPESGGNH